MKIESSSSSIVHPARPPPSGTTIILSNNDQVMPRMYVNMLYYFPKAPSTSPSGGDDDQCLSTESLKKSLAESLSLFYPLAGRYVERPDGGVDIDCSSSAGGAEFLDVTLSGSFDDVFVKSGWQPVSESQLFLPAVDWTNPPPITETALLQAQITRFECGRVCLGVAVHHHVCDGPSVGNFVKTWAAINSRSNGGDRVSPPIVTPQLDRSALKARNPLKISFDHIEYSLEPPPWPSSMPAMTARRFRFGPEKIQALKKAAGPRDDDDGNILFSSFEALSAHIWKFVTKARQLDDTKSVSVGFAVDGRKRLKPDLPQEYFGNVNIYGCAESTVGDLVSKPLGYAATKIHDAISRITDEYMRSGLDWIEEKSSPLKIFPGFRSFLGPDLAITSWSKFPAYELDFGRGTPDYFGIKDSAWDGLAVLLPGRPSGPTEFLVGLTSDAMGRLQSDREFSLD